MAEFAENLERQLGVPVIDGVITAGKFAEAIVELGKTTSKIKTYQPPENKSFNGILSNFGNTKILTENISLLYFKIHFLRLC